MQLDPTSKLLDGGAPVQLSGRVRLDWVETAEGAQPIRIQCHLQCRPIVLRLHMLVFVLHMSISPTPRIGRREDQGALHSGSVEQPNQFPSRNTLESARW